VRLGARAVDLLAGPGGNVSSRPREFRCLWSFAPWRQYFDSQPVEEVDISDAGESSQPLSHQAAIQSSPELTGEFFVFLVEADSAGGADGPRSAGAIREGVT
jgi:hypothetical protein